MKAFAYLRVSSTGQIDGNGYDRQMDTIEQWAKKTKHTVADVFKESVSGTRGGDDRPAFQEMVGAILKNGVHTIVVESLDRLAREYRVQEHLIIYLASKNIDLIAANTGENITQAIHADPMKKALIQIQGVFAELDRALLVKKLRVARERVKAEKGKCGGRLRYDETEEGRAVLKTVRRLRRKGRGKVLPTWNEVAEELNKAGHRNKAGKPFKGPSLKVLMARAKARR